MAYDEKCAELARHFLADLEPPADEADIAVFTQVIQDTVEAFLEDTKDIR